MLAEPLRLVAGRLRGLSVMGNAVCKRVPEGEVEGLLMVLEVNRFSLFTLNLIC